MIRTGAAAEERAYDYVKHQVVTRAWFVGRPVSEDEVADALGVPNGAVRAGFLRLESDGLLLLLHPSRGALVVPAPDAEVRTMLEARLALEEFAVERITGFDDDHRAAVVDDLRSHVARGTDSVEADRAFHRALLAAAGNELLAELHSSLLDRQVWMLATTAGAGPTDRLATVTAEHEWIVEAIRAADPEAALTAMRTHIATTGQILDRRGSPG